MPFFVILLKKKIIKEKTSSKRISDYLIISDLKITSRFQNKNTNLQKKKKQNKKKFLIEYFNLAGFVKI